MWFLNIGEERKLFGDDMYLISLVKYESCFFGDINELELEMHVKINEFLVVIFLL